MATKRLSSSAKRRAPAKPEQRSARRFWPLGLLIVVGLLGWLVVANRAARDANVAAGTPISVDALPAGLGRGFATVRLDPRAAKPVQLTPGAPAPDFRLQLGDGRYVSLAELEGRPVMINFWATWCPPCRAEMPDIVAAYEANEDLVVLAINAQESQSIVAPFVTEFRMSMPVGLDLGGDLQQLYGVRGMPTSIFIDRKGNVATVWQGLLNAEALTKILAGIL